jgi:ketosteroid isomerase-like protein
LLSLIKPLRHFIPGRPVPIQRSEQQQKDVVNIIGQLTLNWLEGHLECTCAFLDDFLVAYIPWADERIEGREDFVRVFTEVRATLDISRYDLLGFSVRVYGDLAIAHCGLNIEYRSDLGRQRQCGTDLLVFVLRKGTWRLVRRSIVLETHRQCTQVHRAFETAGGKAAPRDEAAGE